MEKKQIDPQQLARIREIYSKMPKGNDLFAFKLNWQMLIDYRVIDSVCKPWIAKKMVDYLGAEEQTIIDLVLRLLKAQSSDSIMREKMEAILDDESADFVEKLWRLMVFEQMKIEAGFYE